MTPLQHQLLTQLLASDLINKGRTLQAAEQIIDNVLITLNIPRAGIWLYNEEKNDYLTAFLVVDKKNNYRDTNTRLKRETYPAYFSILDQQKIIRVNSALNDPSTKEFASNYSHPDKITSLLNIPIHCNGKIIGIMSCEQIDNQKNWTDQEELFTTLLADQFSRCYLTAEQKDQNRKLEKLSTQLFKQTKQLKSLQKSLNNSILISTMDSNGIITDINENYLTTSGYQKEEIKGKSQNILHSSIHQKHDYDSMWRLLNEGNIWQGRICNVKKNGDNFWLDATITPILNSNNLIEGFIGYYQNVTQEVNVENQLKRSEQLANQGSFRLSINEDIWLCSQKMHSMLAIPKREKVTWLDIEKFIHKNDLNRFKNEFKKLSQPLHQLDITVKNSSVPSQWMHFSAKQHGQWIIGGCQNITETVLSSQRYRETIALQNTIFDSANFTVIATTPHGTITHFNKTAEHLLGYRAEEVIGVETPLIIHDSQEISEYAKYIAKELGEPIEEGFETFIAKPKRGMVAESEWTYIAKDGSAAPVSLSITAILNEQDQITGYLAIGKDLTKQRNAEKHSSRLDTILATAGDLANFGGFQYDVIKDRLHITNEEFQQLLSPVKNSVSLQQAINLCADEDKHKFMETIHHTIDTGKKFDIQLRIKNTNDTLTWVRIAGSVQISNKEVTAILGFIHNINDQKILERKLSQLALTDELTGINNRRALMRSLQSEWNRYARYKTEASVLILDIDLFKRVNDRWGHDVGDYVLTEFSSRIKRQLRSSDTFGRLGGEEFLIIASNCNEHEAKILAEKIRLTIENQNFIYDTPSQSEPKNLKITVSIGISGLSNGLTSLDYWLQAADKALYCAKNSGRNKVISYKSAGISVDSKP